MSIKYVRTALSLTFTLDLSLMGDLTSAFAPNITASRITQALKPCNHVKITVYGGVQIRVGHVINGRIGGSCDWCVAAVSESRL